MFARRKKIIIGGLFIATVIFTVFFVMAADFLFPQPEGPTIDEKAVIAENWIRNYSHFYPYHGSNLRLKEKRKTGEEAYEFDFYFYMENPEYGQQNNETTVKMKKEEITSVVTNGVFDEKEGVYLKEND